jgi:hypothetical protein
MESAHITFRKVTNLTPSSSRPSHPLFPAQKLLQTWARRVLAADYASPKTWAYMDRVGAMHNGASSFKHQRTMGIEPFHVPYRDCALLLGWVQQVLQTAILRVEDERMDAEEKIAAVAAAGKVRAD